MLQDNWDIWSRDDLSQYYQQTFVGIRQNGKVLPYLVDRIIDQADSAIPGFIGVRRRGAEISSGFDSKNVVIIIPESTFVNLSETCVYASRTTSRQYKKGVRSNQYQIRSISRDDLAEFGIRVRKPEFNTQIVDGLFEPNFSSFSDCIDILDAGGAYSKAFHKHFCLTIKPHIKDKVMYYKGYPCGTVTNERGINLLDKYCDLEETLIEILE